MKTQHLQSPVTIAEAFEAAGLTIPFRRACLAWLCPPDRRTALTESLVDQLRAMGLPPEEAERGATALLVFAHLHITGTLPKRAD